MASAPSSAMKTTPMSASGDILLLEHNFPNVVLKIYCIGPQVIRLGQGTTGIHSLQNLPPYALPSGAIPRPRLTGYTPTHAQYQNQVDMWRARAYAPSGENVSVNITMAYLPLGKAKEVVLPAINDSIRDLDSHSNIPQVKASVINVIKPKLAELTKDTPFQFDLCQLNLRDITGRMNVDLDSPALDKTTAYFYSQCLKENEKTKQKRFAKPSSPFKLMLLISSEQWDDWEEIQAAAEQEKLSHQSQSQAQKQNVKDFQSKINTGEQPVENSGSSKAVTSKRGRSESMAIPTSPPQSKKLPTWKSPSKDEVAGLLAHGSIQTPRSQPKTWINLSGFFAPIPNISFLDLLQKSFANQFIFDECRIDTPAILSADFSLEAEIGAGGFKSCHPAKLYPPALLRTSAIVLKEVFIMKRDRRARLSGSLEYQKILREANLHYYANALMKFAYSYLDQKLNEKGPPSHLEIPQLRFVKAGMFVIMSQSLKHVKSTDVAPERSFLIEERINTPEDDCFTKFIHNGSAEPNLYPDDPHYQTSLFLCACQHLQYEKTHQLAYVSDFQGCNGLLTDAQIITSPKLSKVVYGPGTEAESTNSSVTSNLMVFGEGNIESCFEKFPEQHECNEFCRWMDLLPLQLFVEEV
ncbi:hypothetical protein D9757_006739 [Collybiopsis confluens]|uniref:Alpha-type protein kinase domain-containing protein n=1 Tax=Collybiopsis confluens TaxID=2823264 RepID=A0A8H5HM66_9AGAR|nr:hypothetical protein D9757_006739 [Collybiopsis confluens]